MVWKSSTKALEISGLQPHDLRRPGIIGRAPSISDFSFSPLALYGACARVSHLHAINPTVVTPESRIMAALIREHVAESGADFAILKTADRFKDHWRTHFAGTVAAGLGYLEMIQDGYIWSDHFENLKGGNPTASASPDYVFTGPPGIGTALMESKGSRTASMTAFNGMVRGGYKRQIEPHLGFPIGGAPATHGYCIGSHLHSPTKAAMRIHHTAVTAAAEGGGSGAPAPAVQAGNYATAFALAHSPQLGAAIRTGAEMGDIPFALVFWRGKNWLTSYLFGSIYYRGMSPTISGMLQSLNDGFRSPDAPAYGFAVEENVAKTVLAGCLARGVLREPLAVETLAFQDEPGASEYSKRREDPPGVIFPDGLAVIGEGYLEGHAAVWDSRERRLRVREHQ